MAGQQQTHWRQVHRRLNASLLFAEDLGGKTRVDVEIIDSGVINVSDGDSSKDMPWIAFKGAKKRLACNATNCKTLQTLSGTGVIEMWRGPITLVVVKTKFKDRKTKEVVETDTIRISPKRPRPYESDRPAPELTEADRREEAADRAAAGAGAGPSDDWYDDDAKTTDEKPTADGYTSDPDADKEQS